MSDVEAMVEGCALEAWETSRRIHADVDMRPWAELYEEVKAEQRARMRAALESLGLPLTTLAALKAGTWQAVPKEPTGDGKPFTLKHNMQRQGAARMWEVTDRQVAGLDMAAEIYRAMLAAAPTQPEDQP